MAVKSTSRIARVLVVGILASLVLTSCLAGAALAQDDGLHRRSDEGAGQGVGKGQGLGKGQGSGSGSGQGLGQGSSEGHGGAKGYFGGNQLVKLIVMATLSGLALGFVAVQGFLYRKVFLLVTVGVAGFYLVGLLCPLCAVQNVFIKWNTAYLLLVLVPVVLTLFVGRVYCGYVCPYGALQELLHVRKWAPRIPPHVRKVLGLLKYAVLVYLAVHALVTWTEILKEMTPFKAFFALGGTPLTYGLSAGFVALSVLTWRPFCEALCPLGALLSLVSRLSLFRLEPDSSCVSCGACTTRCPTATCNGGGIRSADCYLCGDCVRTCGPKSLKLRLRWRRRTPCPAKGTSSE